MRFVRSGVGRHKGIRNQTMGISAEKQKEKAKKSRQMGDCLMRQDSLDELTI